MINAISPMVAVHLLRERNQNLQNCLNIQPQQLGFRIIL